MPEGKHFFIKSKLNDLVLDVEGGSHDPGTRVVTWFQKPDENDNQLWYEDHLTGTIRSKLHDLCLDTTDEGVLVVTEYEVDKENQQWLTAGDRIQDRQNPGKVLDISGAETAEGAQVIVYDAHDAANQKWSFEYNPARFFYIRSQLNDKVMDLKNGDVSMGSKVVMMTKGDDIQDSQLWYEDKHGVICDKLTNYVLDSGDDNKIRLQPYINGTMTQLWTIQHDRIVNRVQPSLVVDIKGGKQKEGAKLISHKWRDQDNQKWHLDFV